MQSLRPLAAPRTGFLTLGATGIWTGSFVWGCPVPCGAWSSILASTQQTSSSPSTPSFPRCDSQNCLQTWPHVPQEAKLPLVENH